MGEHAAWANLDDPIYAEKDLEVFRPALKQSTLPVYFIKGWLPVSADTLFNALMDARYRAGWDANMRQISVLDRKSDGDVMYAAVNLPWPLSNRDYVYHRRVKFFPQEHAFVIICQSAHHASAPECNGLVRVEAYALRMCIRASSGSNDACDFHAEYEDDTDFSIPNYGINFLLHTMLPSFMNSLRAACVDYANYIKKLDDNEIQCIPSQVVRFRSEKRRRKSGLGPGASSTGNLSDSQSSRSSSSKSLRLFRLTRPRGLFMSRKRRVAGRARSDSDDNYSTYSDPSIHPTAPLELSSSLRSRSSRGGARRVLRKSLSMNARNSSPPRSSTLDISGYSLDSHNDLLTSADDFIVQFQKQRIGLHLETDLFSNKVLVAFCEKGSEADKCSHRLEPGVVVTSVNGVPVADFKFTEVLGEIKRARRPLVLGFSYPDEGSPKKKKNRRPREPKSVMKCVVSRDEHNLLRALRPLDEIAAVSAVLKHDVKAPAYSKKLLRSQSSGGSGTTRSGIEYVILPSGYLLYEIDGCYASDLSFAEIAHLLNRNNELRVVSFKPALAVEGDRIAEAEARSALSKRLSSSFRWRNVSFDDGSVTTSTASTLTRPSPPTSIKTAMSDGDIATPDSTTEKVEDAAKAASGVSHETLVSGADVKWDAATPSPCLPDYSNVAVTAMNVSWAWQHVHLLKADERIFSAGLLIDKIETFLSKAKANGVECATAKTVQKAMLDASDFVSRIKDRREAGASVLAEFSGESADDGWQFGQSHFGVTTYWKPADDGSVWLKIDGSIEGVDVFNTVAVLREIDLWNLWFPFCSQSLLLQQVGHADYVPYLCISSPVLQRDAVLKVCAINACYERQCILMMGNSVEEDSLPSSIKVPTCRGWSAGRMEINGLRALIEPLSRTKARTSIVANIDPKCAIPKPLLNFGIKKMAGILLYVMRKEAEKIEKAQQEGADNQHLSRIQGDPSQFYAWLRPLVDQFLDDLRCDALPPMLPLSSTETGGQDGLPESGLPRSKTSPCALRAHKCSRTAAFHREMNAVPTRADHATLVPKRLLHDYLYDFGIWPYLLLLVVFSDVAPEMPFLRVCALKLVFTCACTWFGVPGAFSWQTRQRKREQRELGPLRRRFVVLAGMLDVANSWAMRTWVNLAQCYVALLLRRAGADSCFDRSPLEVRDAENFWLLASAFVFASVVVVVQVVVNI